MNIYQKVYLQQLITQENIKSLIPNIQNQLLTDIGVNSYQDLLPNDKNLFQQKLNNILEHIKEKVNSLTDNLQYQSWVYKILKQKNKEIDEDYTVIKSALIDFKNLCKRPDLTPQQRNINNYQTFQDLQKFILSFQKEYNLQKNIYENLKKLYSNNTYTCYLITNYYECNKLFGGQGYFNSGWCVAKSNYYFDYYLNKDIYYNQFTKQHDGYIVFIEKLTNKPYALLHYDSLQFKDTSDKVIENHNQTIIDCLSHLDNNIKTYLCKIKYKQEDADIDYENPVNYLPSDLINFAQDIFKFNNPNATYIEYYAIQNNLICNQSKKILNCNNKSLYITKQLTNADIFSYKIINCNSIHFSNEFIELPKNFYIPDNIINYSKMFKNCTKLKSLPMNFQIPNGVTDCSSMFEYCRSLENIPSCIIIPNSVKNCFHMFASCYQLHAIPNNLYKSLKNKNFNTDYIFKNIFYLTPINSIK